MKTFLASLAAATLFALAGPALAGDEELCLDCHEPAEDWQGMTAAEIIEQARDTSIKRHADNAELSDEQLTAIVTSLTDG